MKIDYSGYVHKDSCSDCSDTIIANFVVLNDYNKQYIYDYREPNHYKFALCLSCVGICSNCSSPYPKSKTTEIFIGKEQEFLCLPCLIEIVNRTDFRSRKAIKDGQL